MDKESLKKNFDLVYNTKILPNIEGLEKKRKNLNKLALFLFCFNVVQTLVCYFCVSKNIDVLFVSISFFIVVLSFILFILCQNKYRKELKEKFLLSMLSIFGHFQLIQKSVITIKELHKYALFLDGNQKKDEDIIIGKYKNIDMVIDEMSIYKKVNSKNNSSIDKINIFSGLLIKIKMNKDFSGCTVIRQKPMSYEHLLHNIKIINEKQEGIIPPEVMEKLNNPLLKFAFSQKELLGKNVSFDNNGLTFSDKKNSNKKISFSLEDGISIQGAFNTVLKGLEEVKLEDEEFNNYYEVFSTDQVEARYLITPSFIERFKTLFLVMLLPQTHCVFDKGYMFLFIGSSLKSMLGDSSGFFEFNVKHNQTLYDKEIYEHIFKDLISIFEFIHHFKLEQKIGL